MNLTIAALIALGIPAAFFLLAYMMKTPASRTVHGKTLTEEALIKYKKIEDKEKRIRQAKERQEKMLELQRIRAGSRGYRDGGI